ncbi:Gfo/Idh/MocA family protein [Anaerotalea alkaliphila]|uniref:Gfo/Idh/MocA family oxidoreductase n=1 Tax=Anaerotalea alkaliphila TaxID=2662126 RepID=A0A7X5HXU7_9FIRM|nr:Gfo/Idh/MocA family oxidoreductase [Anaerotalea alkaliphila]NDL68653.1 Gfo/Idh/MocA family oxidoreductase [Anaerotalea alkaliphila]
MKKYNIGLIGAGFMAKAHSAAYATMPMFFWPVAAVPVRRTICDLSEEGARDAAARFGFEKHTTDWRDIVNDPEIDIIDIATPNDSHAEIAIAAANAGKHIFCEKPIARTTEEAKAMLDAVKAAGVTNMLAFNYRRTPAVALAKKFISEGSIGKILNFRGTYLQDWSADPNAPLSWRFQKKIAGSGTLGDIGTHVIDIARYLAGEIDEVCGTLDTHIPERPLQQGFADKLGTVKSGTHAKKGPVDVDDEVKFLLNFRSGASGSIEATRNGWGRNNYITFEVHGSEGSIFFNYERRDELQVYFASDPADKRGFRTIYTGPSHPNGDALWPIPALGIGYGETKIIECHDFIQAIATGQDVSPNFEDGYKIELICDAIKASSMDRKWVKTNC